MLSSVLDIEVIVGQSIDLLLTFPKQKCFEMIKNLGLEVGWRMLLGHPYLQGKKTKALSMMREVL